MKKSEALLFELLEINDILLVENDEGDYCRCSKNDYACANDKHDYPTGGLVILSIVVILTVVIACSEVIIVGEAEVNGLAHLLSELCLLNVKLGCVGYESLLL